MRLSLVPAFFLLLPLAEIAGFILVGQKIGLWPTLLLILATTVLGGVLLRAQGFSMLARLNRATTQGQAPGKELVHGAMIVLAGILLLLPGFITDTIGILMFIPAVREKLWQMFKSRITVVSASRFGGGFQTRSKPGTEGPFRQMDASVIELDEDEYTHTKTDRPDQNPKR